MRVLTMQVDQPFAECLELRKCRRASVDVGAALSLSVENPAQEQRAAVTEFVLR